ncbi:MAG: anhydro-N-acetylmuramic acid kinase [Alphaproteobacteria bacterium]
MSNDRKTGEKVLGLGLMSGTSMDGIDVALVWTDGRNFVEPGESFAVSYDASLREAIRTALGGMGPVAEVERRLTEAHISAVHSLLDKAGLRPEEITVIGFHGHTILHRPEERRTWQIGDSGLLAQATGIDVIGDMRMADVAAGGQGAPLVPLYHAALAASLGKPVAVLNIGGVANVTWLGEGPDDILAFDTGPGGALLDEWAEKNLGEPYDESGRLAVAGTLDEAVLAQLMQNPYFDRAPPKSLDRIDFDGGPVGHLSAEDGAATLVAFTCHAAAQATRHFPSPVRRWIVTGGGRHNPVIMSGLAARIGLPVDPVERLGWDGDALEAQAFAYLAVRSLRGLALTLPGTTGVAEPLTGGRLYPKNRTWNNAPANPL